MKLEGKTGENGKTRMEKYDREVEDMESLVPISHEDCTVNTKHCHSQAPCPQQYV